MQPHVVVAEWEINGANCPVGRFCGSRPRKSPGEGEKSRGRGEASGCGGCRASKLMQNEFEIRRRNIKKGPCQASSLITEGPMAGQERGKVGENATKVVSGWAKEKSHMYSM